MRRTRRHTAIDGSRSGHAAALSRGKVKQGNRNKCGFPSIYVFALREFLRCSKTKKPATNAGFPQYKFLRCASLTCAHSSGATKEFPHHLETFQADKLGNITQTCLIVALAPHLKANREQVTLPIHLLRRPKGRRALAQVNEHERLRCAQRFHYLRRVPGLGAKANRSAY